MLPDQLPPEIRAALERFMADQVEPLTDDELIVAALREFLIGHGYLEVEDPDEPGKS